MNEIPGTSAHVIDIPVELQKNPVTGACIKKELEPKENTKDGIDASPGACDPVKFTNCSITERYRSFDGTCNNLAQPLWGAGGSKSRRAFRRIYAAEYPDGFDELKNYRVYKWSQDWKNFMNRRRRKIPNGQPVKFQLPNPRTISVKLHQLEKGARPPEVSRRSSHMLMQFGQFLDHDVTLSP